MEFYKDLWDRALGEIQIEVSKAVFLTLFKETSLVALENKVATVAAPSMMIIDLLERRFYNVIKKALDKQAGEDLSLSFVPKNIVLKKEGVAEEGPLFSVPENQKITIGHLPRVRADFTFENMAVSSTNQLAFVSATSVAKRVGRFYNPLFIYGPVGVGKTHLMQAIANSVYENSPDKKIVYITSEEFTNEVVNAIRTNSTFSMKKKFRALDLLLIDDVQFVAGKEKVQEELFHTFNILVDRGAQVVFSSDRPAYEISKTEKRLLSRFSGGLTVDIEPPDFELRCAILLIKAKGLRIPLPMGGAKIIAQNILDTRAMEGALLKIAAQAESLGAPVTEALIEKAVGVEKEGLAAGFRPEEVIRSVCSFYNVGLPSLTGQRRDASLVLARQVAMYLLKRELNLTFSQIGGLLGGRDHTTIMHGVEKIEDMLTKNLLTEDLLGITSLVKRSFVD